MNRENEALLNVLKWIVIANTPFNYSVSTNYHYLLNVHPSSSRVRFILFFFFLSPSLSLFTLWHVLAYEVAHERNGLRFFGFFSRSIHQLSSFRTDPFLCTHRHSHFTSLSPSPFPSVTSCICYINFLLHHSRFFSPPSLLSLTSPRVPFFACSLSLPTLYRYSFSCLTCTCVRDVLLLIVDSCLIRFYLVFTSAIHCTSLSLFVFCCINLLIDALTCSSSLSLVSRTTCHRAIEWFVSIFFLHLHTFHFNADWTPSLSSVLCVCVW